MTNKERLAAVLAGRSADIPPHLEMVFQLEQEAFGINSLSPEAWDKADAKARQRGLAKQVEIKYRLVEEYNWAAVQGPTGLLRQELDEYRKCCRGILPENAVNPS